MIGFCSLLAYKRNEYLDLWEDCDLLFANLKKEKKNAELFEEKEKTFNKATLFEGLVMMK